MNYTIYRVELWESLDFPVYFHPQRFLLFLLLEAPISFPLFLLPSLLPTHLSTTFSFICSPPSLQIYYLLYLYPIFPQ